MSRCNRFEGCWRISFWHIGSWGWLESEGPCGAFSSDLLRLQPSIWVAPFAAQFCLYPISFWTEVLGHHFLTYAQKLWVRNLVSLFFLLRLSLAHTLFNIGFEKVPTCTQTLSISSSHGGMSVWGEDCLYMPDAIYFDKLGKLSWGELWCNI